MIHQLNEVSPYSIPCAEKCFSLVVAHTGLKSGEGGEELRKKMHVNHSAPPSHIQKIHSRVIQREQALHTVCSLNGKLLNV